MGQQTRRSLRRGAWICHTSLVGSPSAFPVTPVPAAPVRIKPPSPQEIATGDAIKLGGTDTVFAKQPRSMEVPLRPASAPTANAGTVKLADLLAAEAHEDHDDDEHTHESKAGQVPEIGGRRDGPDPTRYGDWEKNGRCIDF